MNKIDRILAAALALSLLTLTACGKKKPEETTAQPTEEPSESLTSETPSVYTEPTTLPPAVPETTTAAPVETTLPPVTAAPETQPPTTAAPAPAPTEAPKTDYASFTKEQTLALLTQAVNQTKAYAGNITVHHKESFDFAITDVQPGGALVQQAVDFVKNLVIKPSEETYSFSGGHATTSEGEDTQLLLPKAAAFTLPAAGVQSAWAQEENGLVHVFLTLVPEECTSLTQVPAYHAASIGYLDIGSSFHVLQIKSVDIKYPGSTIDAYIRPDGYVSAVTYTVKLDAFAEAAAMGITGSAKFGGDQVEAWTVNW